jgi:uncharacterized protein (TIGR03437 family)
MNRKRWILTSKIVGVLSAPLLLWAYSSGAPQRSTGAPGDNTCLRGGCHIGTRTDNSPSLEVLWEGGQNYQPGIKQRFTVRINDTARRYGMQATARLASSTINGAAGTFTPLSNAMYVICDSGSDRPAIGCPPGAPVEFITHSDATTSNTFTFDWTPPASQSAGPVEIYVAANASNGPAPNGAKMHLKRIVLSPGAAGGGARPTISAGGAVAASAFGGGTTIAPGSWIEIYGRDLANITAPATFADWSNSFNGDIAPTNLANTRVTIDGRNAFIALASSGQVNVQVPNGIATGAPVSVRVITSAGESDPVTLTGRPVAPALLAPASFRTNAGRQYVVAQFADQGFAGPPNALTGIGTRLPRPGDRLVIYGVGFGATNPAIAPGTIVRVANSVPGLRVQLGSATVTTEYAGLAPGIVGLYQFNIVVPNVQAGDQEIFMEVGGVRTQTGLFLAVGN